MQRSWVNGRDYARLTAMEMLARSWVARVLWLKNMARIQRLAMSSTNTSRLVRVCLYVFLGFASLAPPHDDQKTPSTEILFDENRPSGIIIHSDTIFYYGPFCSNADHF